jgi:hypothetical protein
MGPSIYEIRETGAEKPLKIGGAIESGQFTLP